MPADGAGDMSVDSYHARPAELASGGPVTAVEHAILQQTEERLNGRMVPGSAYPPHRSGLSKPGEGALHFPARELRSAVGVQHTAGAVAVPHHRVVQ